MQTVMPTMLQFFHDHIASSEETNPELFSTCAELISSLCKTYRKDPEKVDIIISGDLTGKGGNLHFYTMESLSARYTENECRNHFKATFARSILIEPAGYPEIEPYNRQSPYYIGLGYTQFKIPIKTDLFTVYTQIGDYRTSLFTSFDEYSYNNYWLSVTFGLVIKEEDISSFLTKLGIILRPFGYSAEIIFTIINFEERTRTS